MYNGLMRRNKIAEHYTERISRKAPGYDILDWESEEAQLGRFSVLSEHIDLNGRSLLDVGCGVGDLYGYLLRSHIDADYTGVDILEEMVQEAKRRYPTGRFVSGDLFTSDMMAEKSFDVVYSSGIFNLNLGNNTAFLKSALPVFFRIAGQRVVFNLLDPGHPAQSERYAYFDPEEVVSLVGEYAGNVQLVQGYVPHDFTVIAGNFHEKRVV